MKYFPYIVGVAIAAFIGMYAMTQKQAAPMPVETDEATEDVSTEPTTVQPTLVSASSSILLLGTVLSHETANIYPRRGGIVEDVYVDIGDTVTKNQVVALLLPQGVEGQSAAAIGEKRARQAQAESDLVSAQSVQGETIISANQTILEKETSLRIAESEQASLLEKFVEYNENIVQMRDQAFTAVRSARQIIEQILFGSNSRAGSGIYEEDILDQLGLLNTQTRYDVIPSFDQLYSMEQEYLSASEERQDDLINQLFVVADSTILSTLSILSSTPTVPFSQSGKMTQDALGAHTNRLLTAQSSNLKAQERLQDAQSAYGRLVSQEPDLYAAYLSGNTRNATSNAVQMMALQLQNAENALHLTEANQQQIVERNKAMVGVSNAILQSEVAQSGHRQIRSPFAGIVSKRFLNVGQLVSPSMPAFELTGVPTSLAKIAKAEVQFGLPEHLLNAISVGDTVSFFLQTNDGTLHTAEVTRKSPQVDMKTHTIMVQAKIPDDLHLPHQTSVRIRITDTQTPVFRVPSSAVKRKDNTNFIWILESENAAPVKLTVSVTAEDGEFAEITGAITVETNVIVDSPALFL